MTLICNNVNNTDKMQSFTNLLTLVDNNGLHTFLSPSNYAFQITTYEFSPSTSPWHYRITSSDKYYMVPLQITVFLWKNQNQVELQNCSKLRIHWHWRETDSFLPQKITSHWTNATPTMKCIGNVGSLF